MKMLKRVDEVFGEWGGLGFLMLGVLVKGAEWRWGAGVVLKAGHPLVSGKRGGRSLAAGCSEEGVQ